MVQEFYALYGFTQNSLQFLTAILEIKILLKVVLDDFISSLSNKKHWKVLQSLINSFKMYMHLMVSRCNSLQFVVAILETIFSKIFKCFKSLLNNVMRKKHRFGDVWSKFSKVMLFRPHAHTYFAYNDLIDLYDPRNDLEIKISRWHPPRSYYSSYEWSI